MILYRMTLIGFAVVGCVIGVVVQSVLMYWFHSLFMPELLNDGQYFFLPVITAPVGGVVGISAGLAVAFYQSGQASQRTSILIIGGSIACGMSFWSSVIYGPAGFLGALIGYYGVPLLLSVILLSFGVYFLKRRA